MCFVQGNETTSTRSLALYIRLASQYGSIFADALSSFFTFRPQRIVLVVRTVSLNDMDPSAWADIDASLLSLNLATPLKVVVRMCLPTLYRHMVKKRYESMLDLIAAWLPRCRSKGILQPLEGTGVYTMRCCSVHNEYVRSLNISNAVD